jgi:hypothetical protein
VELLSIEDCMAAKDEKRLLTLEEAMTQTEFPFAAMMQGSAVYIAAHAGKVAVFHIPGDLIEKEDIADHLLSDMALCWLLGMKTVIVVGSRYDVNSCTLSNDVDDDDSMRWQEIYWGCGFLPLLLLSWALNMLSPTHFSFHSA